MRTPARSRYSRVGAGWRVGAVAVAALCAGLAAGPAHALFADDEARRAILDLRARLDAQRQALEATEQRLQELLTGGEAARRGVLDVANQLEALRRELAELRGQQERLARDVADVQRQQRDALAAFDERLRALEPLKVTLDGAEFSARPEEKAAFEAAMAALRAA